MILKPLFRPPDGWLSPQQILTRVRDKVKQSKMSKKLELEVVEGGNKKQGCKRGRNYVEEGDSNILSLETPNLEERSKGRNRRIGGKVDISF